MLTGAQRTVGLAIAQQHINHNPESPWFHSAWAAHQTIATETGLTRRTVVSAMVALRQAGLIAIEHGAGRKVPGGRTDRYTLRTDWLDVLECAAHIVRQKDVKNFHRSSYQTGSQVHQSGEKNAESGEIRDQMIGNSQSEHVKDLRTTLSKITPLESLSTHRSTPSQTPSPFATLLAGNGRKASSYSVTAQDHRELAVLLGNGDLEQGYGSLDGIDEAKINAMAVRYRFDRLSGDLIRDEVAELRSPATGSPP
jgi:biotin operon repressor